MFSQTVGAYSLFDRHRVEDVCLLIELFSRRPEDQTTPIRVRINLEAEVVFAQGRGSNVGVVTNKGVLVGWGWRDVLVKVGLLSNCVGVLGWCWKWCGALVCHLIFLVSVLCFSAPSSVRYWIIEGLVAWWCYYTQLDWVLS